MYVNGWLLIGGMFLVLFGIAWLAIDGRDTAARIDQATDDIDRHARDTDKRLEDVHQRIDRGESWTLHLIDDYRARVGAATEPVPMPPTEPMAAVLIGHWAGGDNDPGVIVPVEPWPTTDHENYGRHAHRVAIPENEDVTHGAA
jgi:hypothetical protein